MKILLIGGTGIISSACASLSVERGHDVTLLNRGNAPRPVPPGARVIHGNMRDLSAARSALGSLRFDVVVDFIAYEPAHIEQDIDLFRGRVGQYIFISTAAAYQKPPGILPVTESTLLDNPFWEYARLKIACEQRLVQAYRDEKFPVTIVRPSYTYDKTKIPLYGGYTMISRMRRSLPVVVPGDGTSVWVLTHHRDFAVGLVGLLGNPHAAGEAFHITSEELLTWNQIYTTLGNAAGAQPNLIHLPSEIIARYDKEWGPSLLGDKSHGMFFDNTKIKRAVPDYRAVIPFSSGAREMIDWHDADPNRQAVNPRIEAVLNRLAEIYQGL